MTPDIRIYRLLLLLYPRQFRAEFNDDLVQMFTDLARRDGRTGAWLRCLADAAVSVPRLRLESVMHPNTVATAINLIALLVAAAGVATLALGGAAGLPVLAFAALLALSQRTRLGRALALTPQRRQQRLRTAALLGFVFAATLTSWLLLVNPEATLSTSLTLTHNIVGAASLVGALGYLAAGLLTRPDTTGASRAPAV